MILNIFKKLIKYIQVPIDFDIKLIPIIFPDIFSMGYDWK